MSLIGKIKEDRIIAFKTKENIKKNLLGCLIADSTKIDKEPTDEFVLSIIKKFIDNANFVISKTEDGVYENYQAKEEILILEVYRPQQLSDLQIRILIDNVICKDMKSIMTYFKENYPSQYDGKLVSSIAKEMILT